MRLILILLTRCRTRGKINVCNVGDIMIDFHSIGKTIASVGILAVTEYALRLTGDPICLWALWMVLLMW